MLKLLVISFIIKLYVRISIYKHIWQIFLFQTYCCFKRPQQTFVGLQHVFSITIFRLPRRLANTSWRLLEDISQDVLITSSRRLQDVLEDKKLLRWRHVLKTSWRHILKTSSRGLGGKQNYYWWYLYLTNVNVHLTNLCFTNYIWEI